MILLQHNDKVGYYIQIRSSIADELMEYMLDAKLPFSTKHPNTTIETKKDHIVLFFGNNKENRF